MSEQTKVFEEKMEKSLNNLKSNLLGIRAGRANTHVLDKVMVEAYGTQMPLNQVANISVPEARVIAVQPFDVSQIKAIERGINSADIGINPNSDGKVIRLVFPELDEERRKSLSKDVKKLGEECKVAVRNIRRDAMETVKKLEKKGDITEDDRKNLETEIQKFTDKKIEAVDKAVEAKNKEIMSI